MLYDYRDLFAIFVWREFSIRYRHSLIGILWALIQPLSMMALFAFIFTYVLNFQMAKYSNVLFFYAGLIPWLFFSSSLNFSIPVLTNHYNLITKIYFPREMLPLAGIALALLDAFIAGIIFIILLFIFQIPISWNIIWAIPLFVLLALFTIAVSLFLSSMNVYYRDVRLASGFLIQLWFFASPIMYSIDRLNIKMKVFLFINPLTFIIENMRRCILESRAVVLWQFVFVGTIVCIMLILAYKFFTKTERAFADVI